MKFISCLMILCLLMVVCFAGCKPATEGGSNNDVSSSINNETSSVLESAGETASDNESQNTQGANSDDTASVNSTSSGLSSVNQGGNVFGDNVFYDDWEM